MIVYRERACELLRGIGLSLPFFSSFFPRQVDGEGLRLGSPRKVCLRQASTESVPFLFLLPFPCAPSLRGVEFGDAISPFFPFFFTESKGRRRTGNQKRPFSFGGTGADVAPDKRTFLTSARGN